MKLNPRTKLALVRAAMADGDWDRAIRLAARFQALGQHGSAIRRARDAMNHPDLYKQLGRDLRQIRRNGITALKKRFSKSWEEVEKSNNLTPRCVRRISL